MKQLKDIKLLLIDMDNTLCDTHHSLSIPQWKKVEKTLVAMGKPDHADTFRKAFGKFSFMHTLESLDMSKSEKIKCIKAYDSVDVKNLELYPDAKYIFNLEMTKVLVTRGEPELQRRKIKHLGIAEYFDKIYFVHTFDSKRDAFKKAMRDFKVKSGECLAIGDRIEEEILDANELHIPSVLVRRPDWPVHKDHGRPDMTVRSLEAVAKRLNNH